MHSIVAHLNGATNVQARLFHSGLLGRQYPVKSLKHIHYLIMSILPNVKFELPQKKRSYVWFNIKPCDNAEDCPKSIHMQCRRRVFCEKASYVRNDTALTR